MSTTTTTTTTTTSTAQGTVTETTTSSTSSSTSADTTPPEEGTAPITDLTTVVDEAHAAVLGMLPVGLMDLKDIAVSRATMAALLGSMPAPEMPGDVDVSEQMVPGHLPDDPEVRVKVYRPAELAAGSPAICWIHGGGMVLMSADGDDFACAMRAKTHSCLVVSIDYRLAPETPAPGPVRRLPPCPLALAPSPSLPLPRFLRASRLNLSRARR